MARTHLTQKQIRAPYNQQNCEAWDTKLQDFDHALDSLESGGTTNTSQVHHVAGASTGAIADLAAFTVANDGLTLVAGDRVLVKDQADAKYNGIYVVGTVGTGTAPLTRATDWDAAAEVKDGTIVAVGGGTANADTMWRVTGDFPMTVGTSHQHFVQVYTATEFPTLPGVVQKKTVNIKDEDLSGASQAVNVGTALPAAAVVLAHEVVVAEQVAGLADVTIILGGTDTDAIIASTDLDGLAPGSYQCTLGTHPKGSFASEQLVATIASGAGNLTDLTAGDITINVWYITL